MGIKNNNEGGNRVMVNKKARWGRFILGTLIWSGAFIVGTFVDEWYYLLVVPALVLVGYETYLAYKSVALGGKGNG